MTKLNEKVLGMWKDFILKNHFQPSFAICEIINAGDTVPITVKIALFNYFDGLETDLADYCCDGIDNLLELLANIDYTVDDFNDYRGFEQKILSEYDYDDGINLISEGDFCIINVIKFE